MRVIYKVDDQMLIGSDIVVLPISDLCMLSDIICSDIVVLQIYMQMVGHV